MDEFESFKRNILFFCKDCGCQFQLVQGRFSVFYRCPKYYVENREMDEPVCNNRMTIYEAHDICSELFMQTKNGNLKKGLQWIHKNSEIEVLSIVEPYIMISVKNNYVGGKGWNHWT